MTGPRKTSYWNYVKILNTKYSLVFRLLYLVLRYALSESQHLLLNCISQMMARLTLEFCPVLIGVLQPPLPPQRCFGPVGDREVEKS